MGVSGQRHAPASLCPVERTPGTHCTGGWVGLRAGLDTEVRGKILFPCRGSNPDLPVVQSMSDTILTELPWLPLRPYDLFQFRITSEIMISSTLVGHPGSA
jgi:hypothetical protein